MPLQEAPSIELGSAPENASIGPSPSPSEISTTSSPEPQHVRPPPMFRILAMPPPDPEQPPGQEELERRLPGYRRIVIPRELTLIELLKQCSGAQTDDDVLRLREAKLKVIAERVGLRRLHILVPRLRSLTLDGSAISSLRDLGIGLVKLKVLSINRCGLTSLDGIFGLSALRELHAGGNKIRDLQPLAALQKLHTLDLSKNPITETSRLWTLGICSSLRKLCLMNTPLYDLENYRSHVASALPLLMYLDDRPLHLDTQYDDLDTDVNAASSSSDSEEEELTSPRESLLLEEPDVQPSTSKECVQALRSGTQKEEWTKDKAVEKLERRRPATTEGIGSRPERPALPPRPHTAQERQNKLPQTVTRLEFMNTLLEDEWRCSGSALTSRAAVCGNLALALRGGHAAAAAAARHRAHFDITEVEKEMAEQTLADAVRALADEIPRAPRLEDWNKFRQETGINIDIDFNARPVGADPTKAIERLEMIERETNERLEEEKKEEERKNTNSTTARYDSICFATSAEDILSYDFDMWTRIEEMAPATDVSGDVDIYDSNESRPRRNRHRHNSAAEN